MSTPLRGPRLGLSASVGLSTLFLIFGIVHVCSAQGWQTYIPAGTPENTIIYAAPDFPDIHSVDGSITSTGTLPTQSDYYWPDPGPYTPGLYQGYQAA
jgi:hypothetical protein